MKALVEYALRKQASDIHFVLDGEGVLEVSLRVMDGLKPVFQTLWRKPLFEYLKFLAGFDLTNPHQPQSGQFRVQLEKKEYYCRFSVIPNQNLQTGVLRIHNAKKDLKIEELCSDPDAIDFMHRMTTARQGLLISAGPTNSGKTTTLHAILHEIARQSSYKVVSLEDPIEIEDPLYLQLQINEAQGFTYEKGIEELLRHDPDVIFIGEVRSPETAHMVVRAALTGHLVVTTTHAADGLETIQRFLDFGVDPFDLQTTLTAIMAQRLYKSGPAGQKGQKECVYEITEKNAIRQLLQAREYPPEFATLARQIERALEQGRIADRQAQYDLIDLQS